MRWRRHNDGDLYAGEFPASMRVAKSSPSDELYRGGYHASGPYPVCSLGPFETESEACRAVHRATKAAMRKALRSITK